MPSPKETMEATAIKGLLEHHAGQIRLSEDDRRMYEDILEQAGKGIVATTCVECGTKGHVVGSRHVVHKTIFCVECQLEPDAPADWRKGMH